MYKTLFDEIIKKAKTVKDIRTGLKDIRTDAKKDEDVKEGNMNGLFENWRKYLGS